MIFTDFAPNETGKDAGLAFRLLFQPWRWQKGKETQYVKRRLKSRFFTKDVTVSLFLTGRSALYQYLGALGLDQESEVLVQAFTCEAVILPILEHGLHPIYVDIGTDDYSMDFEDLESKVSPKSRVIILQHTFGITPHKRKQIIAFAKQHKLILIEDVAHGFDMKLYKNKALPGAILMSFGRSKLFSGVFGGAMITKDARLSDKMKESEKSMPNPGFIFIFQILWYKLFSSSIKKTYFWGLGKTLHFLLTKGNFFIPEITKEEKKGSFSYSMHKIFPNICAIFISSQLDTFNDVMSVRKRVTKYYDHHLHRQVGSSLGLLRYPYLCQNPKKIIAKSKKAHIQLGRWYSQVVAPPQIDLTLMKYISGSCPNAETICAHMVNLPTNISISQAKRVVHCVEQS